MNATAIRDRRQTTLPLKVARDAGLKPGDQVEWWVEAGEIRGRKIIPRFHRPESKQQFMAALKRHKRCLNVTWEDLKKETR